MDSLGGTREAGKGLQRHIFGGGLRRKGGASESERAKRRSSARRERVPWTLQGQISVKGLALGLKGKVGNDVVEPRHCKGKV